MPSPRPPASSTAALPVTVTASDPSIHRLRVNPVASSGSSRPEASSPESRSAEEAAYAAASSAMTSSIVARYASTKVPWPAARK